MSFDQFFHTRIKPFGKLFADTEKKYGLPSGLLAATAWQESKFNPKAFNPNAQDSGLFQFIPGTAKLYGLHDPFDPVASTDAAGRLYRDLLKTFNGRVEQAVAAYNTGPKAVLKRLDKQGNFSPNAKQQEYMSYVVPVVPEGAKAMAVHGGRGMPMPAAAPAEPEGLGNQLMARVGMPVLNALVTPAEGAEQEFNPEHVQWDDEKPVSQAEAINPEHVQWDDTKPAAETGSWFQRNKPTIDQAARVTAHMLAAPVVGPLDLANDAVAGVVNNIRPGTIETQPLNRRLDYMLKKAGIDPQSAGTAEDVIRAFVNAGFGASSISKVVPFLQSLEKGRELGAGVPMGRAMAQGAGMAPLRQATAASGSVLGSEVAGNVAHDLYPQHEQAARIGGGMVGALGGSLGAGMASGTMGMVDRARQPFTRSGQEQIAGRILNKNASAPMSGAARDELFNTEIVPGSQPTLAEVRQDPGLARLQRVLPSSQVGLEAGVGDLNNIRIAQMDRAIDQMMSKVNKTGAGGRGDWLEAVKPLQDRIYSTFKQNMADQRVDLNQQPVDVSGTLGELQRLAVSKVGKSAVEDLINKVGSSIVREGPEGVHPQGFQKIWNIRQDLDRLLYEKLLTADKGSKKELKDVGEQIRSAMNRDLVQTVPEFGQFLDRYARVSRAGGRMSLGRELYNKTLNTGRNIADAGEESGGRVVSNAKMENLNIPKEEFRAGTQLSGYQRQAFDQAKREKARGNILINGGTPGNSQTAQNLALDNIIARDIAGALGGDLETAGKSGFLSDTLRRLGTSLPGRMVQMTAKNAQNDIMRMVAQGLIDPVEGARLMKLGKLKENASFRNSLGAAYQPGVLAEMFRNLAR